MEDDLPISSKGQGVSVQLIEHPTPFPDRLEYTEFVRRSD